MRTTKVKRKLDPQRVSQAIEMLKEHVQHIDGKQAIGYPCNAEFELGPFFEYWHDSAFAQLPFNDVGNPFSGGIWPLNVRPFERQVLAMMADLVNFDPDEYWGFITSGGTQGNEQALYLGREHLRQYGEPILYTSNDTHHSIFTLSRLLDLELCIINAQPSGEMDYDHLLKSIDGSRPALFNTNIGTTYKGAIDDVFEIEDAAEQAGVAHAFYHADAALFGGYLPYLNGPRVDFSTQPFDSIAISGHKFYGSPIPVGTFLIRLRNLDAFEARHIEYINTDDTTIPCSRSTLAILVMWWALFTTTREQFKFEAEQLLENSRYLYGQLVGRGIKAWLNEWSNIVYFTAPSDPICAKWSLSSQTDPVEGRLAHVAVMQHVTKERIDLFIKDLVKG